MRSVLVIVVTLCGIAALVSGVPANRKICGEWKVMEARWYDVELAQMGTSDEYSIVEQVQHRYEERHYEILQDGKFTITTRSGSRSGVWELRDEVMEFRFNNKDIERWNFIGGQPEIKSNGILHTEIRMGNSVLKLKLKTNKSNN